jgi:beta-amylase
MMASLKQAAIAYGQPSWASGPNSTGTYDSTPSQTGFFGNGANNYASPFGQWFLTWYANMLIDHGEAILGEAHQIFTPFNNVSLAAKIAGIHWLYFTPSHAAELTAGYKNDQGNGYLPVCAALCRAALRR